MRVHMLEAQDLVPMDTVMMGLMKGKSDPYAVLTVGNKRFQTKTIKETLNPRWNEVYEVRDHAFLLNNGMLIVHIYYRCSYELK